MAVTYRIFDWSHRFENSSSRKLKRLDWIALPTTTDIDEGYIILVDHPNGAAHFGAWITIVQIASRQDPRGILPNGKLSQSIGGICQSLGRISRLPVVLFEEVIPRLIEIGWIEKMGESADALGESADVLGESADVLGESADTLGESPVHITGQDSTRQNKEALEQTAATNGTREISKLAAADFPKTTELLTRKFPAIDSAMVSRIIQAATQAWRSVDNPRISEPGDDVFAAAVEAAKNGKQTSAALFLRTVPAVISNWARSGRAASNQISDPNRYKLGD
jgi:hypothetical protein